MPGELHGADPGPGAAVEGPVDHHHLGVAPGHRLGRLPHQVARCLAPELEIEDGPLRPQPSALETATQGTESSDTMKLAMPSTSPRRSPASSTAPATASVARASTLRPDARVNGREADTGQRRRPRRGPRP